MDGLLARSSKKRSMVVIYRYGCISKGMYVLIRGGGLGLQRGRSSKKMGPLGAGGGQTLF